MSHEAAVIFVLLNLLFDQIGQFLSSATIDLISSKIIMLFLETLIAVAEIISRINVTTLCRKNS